MLRPEVLRWNMYYRSHEHDVETMIQKLRDFFDHIRKDARAFHEDSAEKQKSHIRV